MENKDKTLSVLVTGALGYIGNAVALALRRQGHTVYGLIRSQSSAIELEKNEIIPVVGSIEDVKLLEEIVKQVSVVVDAVMIPRTSPTHDVLAANRNLIQVVAASSKSSGVKKRYIYTSGLLVYGDHPSVEVDEDESKFPLKGLNTSRIALEKLVKAQTDCEGVVVRAAWVYGGSGGHYMDDFWKVNNEGKLEITGKLDKVWSVVHLSDLADAFVLIVEAQKVAGELYNVSDDTRVDFYTMKEAMALAAGAKLKENESRLPYVNKEVNKSSVWEMMLDVTNIMSSKKIRTQFNWKPKHQFLKNLPLYYKSYVAHKKAHT